MKVLKFKRFPKLTVLKRIRRPLLEEFLSRFECDLRENGLKLPPCGLSDEDYLNQLAALLKEPEGLPDSINDAIAVIEDLAAPRGFERLEAAPDWQAWKAGLSSESAREETVLRLWLRDRNRLIRQHNALRLVRLTAFEYAATKVAPENRPPFDPTDKHAMLNLAVDLDRWFAQNQRGSETTRIEFYPLQGEYYFLIRHGDLFTRMPKVRRQDTEFLQFHPERDDVVVVSPVLDEIRVNARTRSERDLYIAQFGLHLRASPNYFSERAPYTLEPLRRLGAECLNPRNVPGLDQIRLRELEVAFEDRQQEVIQRSSRGLFELADSGEAPTPIPTHGRLARAVFEMRFRASKRFSPLEIRVPNVLKVSHHCDFAAVRSWLCQTGFRIGQEAVGGELVAA